ncbi:glycosyltransferase [Thomasclavelia cocleata]|jgi:glycosyltransferase involved in cell wall biosynthesis|uniref:glycosyltransferase n=2 Tax=Bacteria TaxID=2 RepID=UPI002558367F|nr:glycosyltransferase [Thomasclavelia cocleata]
MAAKYRAPIFQLMDKEMDVDWYFGNPIGDIKGLEPELLKNATIVNRKIWKGLTWQKGILKHLVNKKYDRYLMLGEPFTLSTWAFMLLKKIVVPEKKVYLWSHGWYGRENFTKKWIKRAFFGLADGNFLYGNYARKVAIEQGNNPDKLWVIHNSLNYSKHIELRRLIKPSAIYKEYFGDDNPVLIFIGRLTKIKKLNQIFEAVAFLKKQGSNYNVVLVGDGEERSMLEIEAIKLKIPVWFYGSCYDEIKNAELIYNADLCVSPGNVGLTAIHAMTFGTPVITHSNFSNQMPEFEAIIPNKTGNFFTENSIENLVESISKWFSDKNYSRERIRQYCYKEIDNFWTPKYQLDIIKKHLS